MTKEEDKIARFVRFNCPSNVTMFEGNEVHYFSGKKAVDLLVESKKYGANSKDCKFPDALSAEDFLQSLLERGLFFRAKKTVLKKKDKNPDRKNQNISDLNKSPKVTKKDKEMKQQDEKQIEDQLEEKEREEKIEADEDKKKKKKVKLTFNEVQLFEVDTNDVYVWIFDPTPFWKKCVGVLIVLGTIGGCLFPLWPDWLRIGIYYLSVTGIGLFGLLLGVALARTILFALIWLFTLGRHYLWVLPNLMEDCGFFESFQPFYTYEYVPGGIFAKNEPKKKKKDMDSDEQQCKQDNKEEKEPLIQQVHEDKIAGISNQVESEGADATDKQNSEENLSSIDEQKPQIPNDGTELEDGGSSSKQSVTDDSNSWDRLSQNSKKSSDGSEEQSTK